MGVIRLNRLTWFINPSASWFGVKQVFSLLSSSRDYSAMLQQLASGPTVLHLSFYRCLLPCDFVAPPLLKGYSMFSSDFGIGHEVATHSSILAWRTPQTEEPGRLQSMGSQELDTTERLNHHHHHETCLGKQNIAEMIVYLLWVCGSSRHLATFKSLA